MPQSRPWLRFPPPLIEPDVRIYRIRLSDGLHSRACTERRRLKAPRGGSLAPAAWPCYTASSGDAQTTRGSSHTRQCPLRLPPKRTRTRAPSLHQHYPASSVPWAPPTSTGPEADHCRSPRLVAATHHLLWISHVAAKTLYAHADSTTPAGGDGFSGRLLPRPPTAFPFWQEGRLQRETIEAFSEFTCFSACALAPRLPEDFPGGSNRTVTRIRLLQWLPGEPTIPRTGLAPAGLRDPGGLSAL